MTLADAVDDLHRQVDNLLNPRRERVPRLDGTTSHVNVPSVWRQLNAALANSRTLTGGGGGAGARLPLDAGALDVLVHITFEVTSRTRRADPPLTLRRQYAEGTRARVDVPANLRQLAQHAVASRNEATVTALADDIRSWVSTARGALPPDGLTHLVRNFPCPACRSTHLITERHGETVRDPGAVLVTFRDDSLRSATCRICGTTWTEPRELQRLYTAATERNRMDPAHHIAFTVEPSAILAVATCTAPARAGCRLTCPQGCATVPCGHPLEDAGYCFETQWLNEYGPTQAFAGDPQPPVNGPIDIEWDGQFYGWTYTHPIAVVTVGDPSVEMAASA